VAPVRRDRPTRGIQPRDQRGHAARVEAARCAAGAVALAAPPGRLRVGLAVDVRNSLTAARGGGRPTAENDLGPLADPGPPAPRASRPTGRGRSGRGVSPTTPRRAASAGRRSGTAPWPPSPSPRGAPGTPLPWPRGVSPRRPRARRAARDPPVPIAPRTRAGRPTGGPARPAAERRPRR